MSTKTAAVAGFGPSGAGKSPLGDLFDVDLVVEPHRVRPRPRPADNYYLSPPAYEGLVQTLESRGGPDIALPKERDIKVYGHVVTFRVGADSQVLFLPAGAPKPRRKLEIWSPILVRFLTRSGLRNLAQFDGLVGGHIFLILLNPCGVCLAELDAKVASDPDSLIGKRLMSIQRRRDKAIGSTTNEEGRRERVRRVADEVPAWRELQALGGRRSRLHFIECAPWPHVEATYYTKGTPEERDQHRTRRLVKARRSLLRCARKQITDPEALALFEGLLKAEDEL